MRIISGKFKGRHFTAPKNLPVRPTTDRAKEALFNILRNKIDFSAVKVLDLFTGIGSIAFEFSSRGATDITCVDRHVNNLKFINATAHQLGISLTTVKKDVFSFLSKPSLTRYDVIFADPPYDFSDQQFEQILLYIFQNNYLNEAGILIIEHSRHTGLSEYPHFTEQRKYGTSVFSFFSK